MEYTQIQILLKLVLLKNNYTQKSDWQLIVGPKRLEKIYIKMEEYGKKMQNYAFIKLDLFKLRSNTLY